MSDTATIRFTGTVKNRWPGEKGVTLVVEAHYEGAKYPQRGDVFCADKKADGIEEGDRVEVTCDRIPYAKGRTYTNRDGEEKVAADVRYYAREVRIIGASDHAPAPVNDDDIPF